MTVNGAGARRSPAPRHRASLHAVYVDPAWRGQGLVDALLDAAIGQGRHDGLSQIELTVAADHLAAQAAYRRAGFAEVAVMPRALRVQRPAGASCGRALRRRRVPRRVRVG